MERTQVSLSEEERAYLGRIIRKGKANARKLYRARVLLKADEGMEHGKIAELLAIHYSTVTRICQRYSEGGLDTALDHAKAANTKPHRLDGRAEAKLIQLACSQAPEGRAKWTLQLLADKLVELKLVESVSPETVRTSLKKTNCRLT